MITQANPAADYLNRVWLVSHPTPVVSEETLDSRAVNGDLDAFSDLVLKYQEAAYQPSCKTPLWKRMQRRKVLSTHFRA
jgi:hypothetical protein